MPKRKISKTKTNGDSQANGDGEFSDKALERILNSVKDAREGALRWMDVQCPHCGEEFEVCVDPSEEGHEMVQDCQVCCKAVQLSVEMEDGQVSIFAYRS